MWISTVTIQIAYSNTYKFYKDGWNGLGIDAESSFNDEWLKYLERDCFIHAVIGTNTEKTSFYKFANDTLSTTDKRTMERYATNHGQPVEAAFVEPIPSEKILIANDIPKNFDLLCCDVEGSELAVLRSINFKKFRPKVILIEIKLFNLYKPCN
jgi:hypothetical protein